MTTLITVALAVAAAFGLGAWFGYNLHRAGERLAQLTNLDDIADVTRRWQAAEIEVDHLRGELHDTQQQMRALSVRSAA